MEVGQSESLVVTGQTRHILAGIQACCVTPGNVAVPSPRVPTQMCLKQPCFPHFHGQGGPPRQALYCFEVAAFSLTHSAP